VRLTPIAPPLTARRCQTPPRGSEARDHLDCPLSLLLRGIRELGISVGVWGCSQTSCHKEILPPAPLIAHWRFFPRRGPASVVARKLRANHSSTNRSRMFFVYCLAVSIVSGLGLAVGLAGWPSLACSPP
jgi:hypothetical protein